MNSDDLNRILALPEVITCKEINDELVLLLERIKAEDADIDLIMNALFELADRQWHTYEYLEEKLKDEVESLILRIWRPTSLDSTEKLLGIIARLGLSNAYADVVKIDRRTLLPDVAVEIEQAISEFGNNVDDPYKS